MSDDNIDETIRTCKQALNEAEKEAYKEDVPVDTERLLTKVREASYALSQVANREQPLSKDEARQMLIKEDGSVDRERFASLQTNMRDLLHDVAPPSEEDIEFMRKALDDRLD